MWEYAAFAPKERELRMALQVLFSIRAQHRQIFLLSPEPLPSTLHGTIKTTGLSGDSLVF